MRQGHEQLSTKGVTDDSLDGQLHPSRKHGATEGGQRHSRREATGLQRAPTQALLHEEDGDRVHGRVRHEFIKPQRRRKQAAFRIAEDRPERAGPLRRGHGGSRGAGLGRSGLALWSSLQGLVAAGGTSICLRQAGGEVGEAHHRNCGGYDVCRLRAGPRVPPARRVVPNDLPECTGRLQTRLRCRLQVLWEHVTDHGLRNCDHGLDADNPCGREVQT
mmetsp:Transcript_85696/g.239501  ORF Transcript_85696/g.239501 Transcript_85696/m.239501 type:complete len:218 (-) Transcript_85696:449-1102(-)